MSELLKQAMSVASSLPEADQDEIGERLLMHVEKLRRLREDLTQGVASLDQGGSRPLDVEDVIRRARARNDRD